MEVDGLIESGSMLQGIEIKSGMTVTSDTLRSLSRWITLADPSQVGKNWLIYAG